MRKTCTFLILIFTMAHLIVVAQRAADTAATAYSASDPNIQYFGRGDFSNSRKPVFSAPAVYIKAKFKGVSAVVRFQDEFIYGEYINNYSAIIDNELVVKLRPAYPNKDTVFVLAENLPYGEHSVTFIKRNESGVGKFTFLGFTFGGQILPPDPTSGKKIQIFGNSISSGSANLSGICATWPDQILHSDAYRAFGPILSRAFNADYHLTSVSGIGLVRNYSGKYDPRPMSSVYNLIHLNDQVNSKPWDLSKFVPDVVIIELGTNDFSPGDSDRPKMDTALYLKAYIQFIDTLKTHWPNAQYLCLGSPMLGDGWPDATYQSRSDLIYVIHAIEKHYKTKNDTTVVHVPIAKGEKPGCDQSHPAIAEHVNIARQITPFISKKLGWSLVEGITPGNFKDPLGHLAWENNEVITEIENNKSGTFPFFTLTPNPTENEFTVSWYAETNYSISVLDLHGKILLTTSGTGKSSILNAENLPKGFYTVVWEHENRSKLVSKLFIK